MKHALWELFMDIQPSAKWVTWKRVFSWYEL